MASQHLQKRIEGALGLPPGIERSLLEDTRLLAALFNRQGHLLALNARFYTIAGEEAKRLIGSSPQEILAQIRFLRNRQALEGLFEQMFFDPSAPSAFPVTFFDERGLPLLALWDALVVPQSPEAHTLVLGNDLSGFNHLPERPGKLSLIDSLTGIHNRNYFEMKLHQMISDSQKSASPLALVFMNIDNFKVANDVLGHTKASALMREIALGLWQTTETGEAFTRLNGDEFAWIIPNCQSSMQVIERLRQQALSWRRAWKISGQEIFLTMSLGVALYPQNGHDSETLQKNAEIAMYAAKKKGKDTFCFYDEKLHQVARKRLHLAHALRQSVRGNQISLRFQPFYSLPAKTLAGWEVLARWSHPKHGMVPPDEFISLAEETGYIFEITRYVIGASLKIQGDLLRETGRDFRISINISAQDLAHPELIRQLVKVCALHGVEHSRVQIEITETAVIRSLEQTIGILNRLKALRFLIALDDFGTGYSSLTYLRRLPIDLVKIDKQFIDRICQQKKDAQIVKTIIDLCHVFGYQVVAEGIERPEQLACLQSLGCDFGQGYHFSPPTTESALRALLKESLL